MANQINRETICLTSNSNEKRAYNAKIRSTGSNKCPP